MPAHPERVRRSYYTVEVSEGYDDLRTNCWELQMRISRAEIASIVSGRILADYVLRKIGDEILRSFPQ